VNKLDPDEYELAAIDAGDLFEISPVTLIAFREARCFVDRVRRLSTQTAIRVSGIAQCGRDRLARYDIALTGTSLTSRRLQDALDVGGLARWPKMHKVSCIRSTVVSRKPSREIFRVRFNVVAATRYAKDTQATLLSSGEIPA